MTNRFFLEQCKGVYCVDLDESFQTNAWWQKSASIQPSASPRGIVASPAAAVVVLAHRGAAAESCAAGLRSLGYFDPIILPKNWEDDGMSRNFPGEFCKICFQRKFHEMLHLAIALMTSGPLARLRPPARRLAAPPSLAGAVHERGPCADHARRPPLSALRFPAAGRLPGAVGRAAASSDKQFSYDRYVQIPSQRFGGC